jgi:metal-responsive CopG/Arc/MetJ family transcriptional regulator
VPAAERATVTLRVDVLEEVDKVERKRSRFIAEAVEHELQRRGGSGLTH